jgi:hypothetical protein
VEYLNNKKCSEAAIGINLIDFYSILRKREPSLVGLGRHEGGTVEQALVDDRSQDGLPKKPSCDETGISTIKG